MQKAKADFVLVMDDLLRDGRVRLSPVSREANSFDCPKCGVLISPEIPGSYHELGYEENKGVLVKCKRCGATTQLLWTHDSSGAVCKQFRKNH